MSEPKIRKLISYLTPEMLVKLFSRRYEPMTQEDFDKGWEEFCGSWKSSAKQRKPRNRGRKKQTCPSCGCDIRKALNQGKDRERAKR